MIGTWIFSPRSRYLSADQRAERDAVAVATSDASDDSESPDSRTESFVIASESGQRNQRAGQLQTDAASGNDARSVDNH